MAKRFTDTDKYKKPFMRGLPGAYKIFWDYLYHDCNHAGIWIVDFEIANIFIGKDMPVDVETSLGLFNKDEIRIVVLNNGSKWFIPSFIDFQYGILNENNRAHNSVITILKKYKLLNNKGLIRSLQAHKDKDKELDKEEDKEMLVFEEIRKLYPGTKRGLETEFDNFTKKHKDWKEILTHLKTDLENQIEARKKSTGFIPEWANFSTWINQRKFEEVLMVTKGEKQKGEITYTPPTRLING